MLRCPNCLAILPDGVGAQCPSCHTRLGTRLGRPILFRSGTRLTARPARRRDHEIRSSAEDMLAGVAPTAPPRRSRPLRLLGPTAGLRPRDASGGAS